MLFPSSKCLRGLLGETQGRRTPFEPYMEQVLLEDFSGLVKWETFGCLVNLVAFYDRINGFVNDGKVVVYLNFNKAFGMALEDIFVSCIGLSVRPIKQSLGINSGI